MHLKTKIPVNFKRIIVLFFLLLPILPIGAPLNLFCQDGGFKYFHNYRPEDYDTHPQNWSILQDKRGIIYVANTDGLLEFDGVSWRSIDIPNDTVRSMAIDDKGTIYIGGNNEIGYLSPEPAGTLKYVSLLEYVEDEHKNFSRVWRSHAAKDGIYFRTTKFLFHWLPGLQQMKVATTPEQFNISFIHKGKLYIHMRHKGLMHIRNGSLEFLPGSETFKNVRIYMAAPYGSETLLIGTRSEGFYTYNLKTSKKKRFPTKADDYLKGKDLYYGIRLSKSPGHFALATLRGGLVIIDYHGRMKEIFNIDYGLQNNNVKYVFEDSRGNLWLGLNSGISKIEYVSPLSIYDERANLPGLVQSVIKHHDVIYSGTSRGLYYLSPRSYKFQSISKISGNCWSLLSIGDSILAGTSDGVFEFNTKKDTTSKVFGDQSYVLLQSRATPGRVWVGIDKGLVSLFSKNKYSQLRFEHRFADTQHEIRTIVEDEKGSLWLGTNTQGVLRVDFQNYGEITEAVVTHYYKSHNLPPEDVQVFMAAGHVMFATEKGIYRFNEEQQVFEPDPTLGEEFANGSRGVFRIVEDEHKNIWFHSRSQNFLATHKETGSYVLNPSPVSRIPRFQVNAIYPEPGADTIWFAGNTGLIRFNAKIEKELKHDFPTLIRKVLVNEKLYVEDYKQKQAAEATSGPDFPIFPYRDRNLRFEFSAPFFEDELSSRYQYFLEGYNKDWSSWTPDTNMDYTNLDSGLYKFRVRAKNAYGSISREAVFKFKVLPPWYKTWWAVLIYTFAPLLMVFLYVKWRSGRLEREKQKLEKIVKERTKEINDKNQQLEKQTLQLQEQSEKLKEMDRVKSRFFANISHEFRTPLTLIMGPMEQMLAKIRSKEQKEQLDLMLRNSQRLLGLINQLLDLSRLDSGKMKLQAGAQNIIPFLKGILFSIESLANQKQLELQFVAKEESVTLFFDAEKIEQVICNLLINAIKFTPAGGNITVSVKQVPRSVEISVRDTGIGIHSDQLGHIFDRFYMAEGSQPDSSGYGQEGSGIGLALVKELIELHHGKVEVQSRVGENSGTEFIIRLPLGKKHLKAGEIVDSPEAVSKTGERRRYPALYIMEKEEKEAVRADEKKEPEEDIDKEIEPREKNLILVVDDNPDVRNYIRKSLEPQYCVEEARDGQEGIDKAKVVLPDLIISDVMMPRTDGYKLCNILKNDIETSHIPVILLTAKAAEENIIQGLETGADDYLTKPFNTKILLTRIKNLIDLRCQLQMKIQREKMLLPAEISVSSIDESFFKGFQDTLEENLSDPDLNIDQLCKKLYLGRTTLFRKIEALTGQTPNQFIQSYRLERAAQLLKANFGNVTEVAFEVGFSSSAYFTKCFKEKYHQLPSTLQASESSPGRGTASS